MSGGGDIDLDALARRRFARTLGAIARHRVDLLLLARSTHAYYASGARRVQVAGSGGFVPWVAVAAGAPSPIVYTPDLDGVPPWASGRGLRWDSAKLAGELRALVPSPKPRIAIDAVSPRFLAILRSTFPGAEWVDGDRLVCEARAVKDEDEVRLVAEATAVAERTLGRVIAAARPGMRERELAAAALSVAIQEGASTLAHEGTFRVASGSASPTRGAGERTIADGDLVAMEVAVVRSGYQGEAAVTVRIGAERRASAAATGLLDRWREALETLAAACGAGADEQAIRGAVASGVRGLPYLVHGIGTGVEPPLVDLRAPAARSAPLVAGMTLVIEPALVDPAVGWVRGSATIVVGERAARRLSGASPP